MQGGSGKKDSGYYILLMFLRKGREISIGRKGEGRFFPRGWYAYAGSARRGLSKRIERHLAKNKKMHWHIDYLLESVEIRRVFVIPDPGLSLRNATFPPEGGGGAPLPFECCLADTLAHLPGAQRFFPRFGSGDCFCPGHLSHLRSNPGKAILRLDKFEVVTWEKYARAITGGCNPEGLS